MNVLSRSRRFGRRSARLNTRCVPGCVAEALVKVAVTDTVSGVTPGPGGGSS